MARLFRDAVGVPHVRGVDVHDVARGQGLVVSLDRTWQLEWLRRRATGTTAELLGEQGLPWDRFARRAFLLDTARRAYAALRDDTRAFVDAYVDGVNAGLATAAPAAELHLLGAQPQPWPAWMPLAVFHAQHLLFAGLGGKLWRRRAQAVLGDDAALLSHEGLSLSGSNAWAVGGARTASGRPLIGGDPHRVIESPGVYLQVRLACEDPHDRFDVVGFAFAGVPGVQHFAHAGPVAWAITNGCGDYQDVHEEEQPPRDVVERRTETVAVRGGPPVEVEAVRTRRGMVVDTGHTGALSLRDASSELGDLGFDALPPLLRARSVDDVDRALDAWVAPVNNVVMADAAGAVRYRLAGRVPTRDTEGRWTGWLGAPRHDVPDDGHVVTANERRGPESADVGREFAPPYRARRIDALLAGRTGLATADFVAILDDDVLATVPLLATLVPGAFDDFDASMAATSQQAGRFAAWRDALVRRIVEQPVLAPLRESPHDPVFDASLDLTARVALALPSLAAARRPFGLDLPELARSALDDVDAAIAAGGPVAWGDSHVFAPAHVLAAHGLEPPETLPVLPVSGDQDCVRCTTSYPGETDVCFRGSVARYVWDLADRGAGGWVVPTGTHGSAASPHHHDQLEHWVEGRLVPIVTDWRRLSEVHDEVWPTSR